MEPEFSFYQNSSHSFVSVYESIPARVRPGSGKNNNSILSPTPIPIFRPEGHTVRQARASFLAIERLPASSARLHLPLPFRRFGPPQMSIEWRTRSRQVPDGVLLFPTDRRTVEALAERGIKLTRAGKGLGEISNDDIDLIIVVGSLDGPVPSFPSRTRWEYWPVSDPRKEAGVQLESTRRVIDDLGKRVAGLFLDYRRSC